jgi:hypothetical protein
MLLPPLITWKEYIMPNIPIQTVAWTIRPEGTLFSRPFVQVSFPTDWFSPLAGLQAERGERVGKPNTFQIRSLNAILRALTSHFLTAPLFVGRREDKREGREQASAPWLIADELLSLDHIWLIIQAWLEKTYQDCESFAEVQQLLRFEDLQWKKLSLPISAISTAQGQAVLSPLMFKVVPALLAERLIESGIRLPIGDEVRPLLLVPVEHGAELITWPPAYYTDKHEERWGYSYVLTITLQTFVGTSEPRVHLHYGVRRWHSHPCFDGQRLALGQRTSVYLRNTQSWLGLAPNNSCTVARLEALKSGGQRIPVWMDLVPDIAQRLGVPFPRAEMLTRAPERWLEGVDGVEAGIVYITPRFHPIGPGIGPDVCEVLTRQVTNALEPELVLRPPLKQYQVPHMQSAHPLTKDLREMAREARLTGLEKSVGSQVTIEVLWQTERVRDMLVDRVLALLTRPLQPFANKQESSPHLLSHQDITPDNEEIDDIDDVEQVLLESEEVADESSANIGVQRRQARKRIPEPKPSPAPEEQLIALPAGGQLRIITRPLNEIGSPLPAPELNRRQDIRARTNDRVNMIRSRVPSVSEPTLALIELPNYQDPRKPDLRRQFRRRDPKPALRLGLAYTNRVTQFITSDEEGLRDRADSAVRDGLRHLGYLPAPIGFIVPHLRMPEQMVIAAVWFVRITRRRAVVRVHLPVVVLFHTSQQKVYAWLPDNRGVRPYRQALLDIIKMSPQDVSSKKRKDALNQVKQFLQGELMKQGASDVVVYLHAQNARATWCGMNNNEAVVDALRFESTDSTLPATNIPGRLRLIRLRTSLQGETPEWYIPGSKPGRSAQGIWFDAEADIKTSRLFYSIAGKPRTVKTKYRGKQLDPRESYRVSSIVEGMSLILQEGDEPEIWPLATYQWRKMGFLTNDMTLLPLPLEFAQKMDEYAEVIGPWIFPEEWNDEDDENDDMDVE